jgi:hypothetical protein
MVANGSSTYHKLPSIQNSNGDIEGSLMLLDSTITEEQKSQCAYIRIVGLKFDNSAIATINEIIEIGTIIKSEWCSTGHSFVPADYEHRIINLEDRATSVEKRLDEMSTSTDNTITYIAEEAKRVANIVQEKRTVGNLTFTTMSDFHV